MVALPDAASLPAVLPVSSVGALGVEQVVGDLERGPEVAPIGRELMALRERRAAQDRAGLGAVLDQAPGFQRLQARDLGGASRLAPSASMSIIWPPAMPRAPEAAPSAATSSQRACGSEWVSGSASTSKARGLQRVAGEDRGRLVEGAVRGGLAAPKVVVVHGGQVVMHQGIGVQHLDRGSDPRRAGWRDREQRGGLDHEESRAAACRRLARHSASPPQAAPPALRPRGSSASSASSMRPRRAGAIAPARSTSGDGVRSVMRFTPTGRSGHGTVGPFDDGGDPRLGFRQLRFAMAAQGGAPLVSRR